MKVLTCEQMRLLEQKEVNEGTPYSALMLSAGEQVAKQLIESFKPQQGDKIAVLCGKGNNGGDGYVAAEYLRKKGYMPVILLVVGEPKTPLSSDMLSSASQSQVQVWRMWEQPVKVEEKIAESKFIIDAIYGIGFKGQLSKELSSLAYSINQQGKKVISCDIPSGVEGDSGFVHSGAFRADITVTFSAYKPAHILYPGMDYCGKVIVKNVGIRGSIIEQSPYLMRVTDNAIAKGLFPVANMSDNKGSNGTLLALCGSYGMAGAAVISLKSALYCGVGLVRTILPQSIYPIVAGNLFEPVFLPVAGSNMGTLSAKDIPFILEQSQKASCVLIGCGLGLNEDTEQIVIQLVKNSTKPLIIDADGINALAKHIDVLKEAKAPVIITPHPGEMARLLKTDTATVQINRRQAVKRIADTYGTITVLKGANTLIAMPQGDIFVNTTGNNGMAKGGSGDALAGIIASFVARGVSLFKAAVAGVYFHGVAGDIAAVRFGKISMQPTDIINALPQILREL